MGRKNGYCGELQELDNQIQPRIKEMPMHTNESTDSAMSRRQFVTAVAAATTTAALAAPYVRAEDKSGLGPVIIGKDGCRFEVVRGWGKLPDGIAYGTTHGVGIDKQGRVFIHNTGKEATMIFDPDGNFIKSWGAEFAGGAHGFDIVEENGQEFAYMSDTRRRVVVKTTLDGEVVVTFPTPPMHANNINQYCPTNITPLPNGDILVGDGYGSSYLHQYTKDGQYVRPWSGKGSEPGKVNSPHGLWLDTRGEKPVVIVCDRGNNRLQLFDTEGKHLGFVTEGMRMPCHIDIRGKETLVPDLRGVVTILDDQYRVVVQLGDNPEALKESDWGPNYNPQKLVPGKFVTPHDACFDKDGNIYVTEWLGYGRVTKLKRIG